MAARFNVKKRGPSPGGKKRPDKELIHLVVWDWWQVYPEYWIEERRESFKGNYKSSLGLSLPDKTKTLKPGSYIFAAASQQSRRSYNPIVEAPNLFQEFCKIGSKPYDKSAMLEFTRKYGMLENYLYTRGEEKQQFYVYSIEEFYYQAWSAYQVFNLFIALGNRDRGSAVKHIKEIYEKHGWGLDERLSHILYTRYYNSIPEDYKVIVTGIETMTSDAAADGYLPDPDEKELLLKALEDNAFPAEPFFRLAQEAIFWPFNIFNGAVYPKVIMEPLEKNQGRLFSPYWAADSLLSGVWFQFYLKITGQAEAVYRICPVCGEPIENPRKNQEYHPGCRQVAHNRKVRQSVELWKEGKTLAEIAAITGAKWEMIKKWIDKESGKSLPGVKTK